MASSTTSPPPSPPPLPLFPPPGCVGVFYGTSTTALTLGTGPGVGSFYAFSNASLLRLALTQRPEDLRVDLVVGEHNQDLAMTGDSAIRFFGNMNRIARGGDRNLWSELHGQGIGYKGYQAWIFDQMGIRILMTWADLAPGTRHRRDRRMSTHEKSTVVEALVGAVAQDSGGDPQKVKEVLGWLGLLWPEDDDGAARMNARMDAFDSVRNKYAW